MTTDAREKAVMAAMEAYNASIRSCLGYGESHWRPRSDQHWTALRAAIDAYERALWRPIGEHDGSEADVFLFFPEGYWVTGERVAIGFWSDGDWYEAECDSKSMTAFGSRPTKYRPLPSPPTNDAEGRG